DRGLRPRLLPRHHHGPGPRIPGRHGGPRQPPRHRDRRRRVKPVAARRRIPATGSPFLRAADAGSRSRLAEVQGADLMILASLVIGASFVASSLLTHFPLWGGQAIRFTAAALVLGALCGRRWRLVQTWPAGVWLRIAGLAITGM